MNRTGIALLSAAALLAAGSATAGEMDGGADISWTYGQIGYVKADGNDYWETDGFDLAASIALSKNWHAGLSYNSMSSDSNYYAGDNLDADTWAISVGYNAGLTKNSQAYFDIGYFDRNYDRDGYDGGEGDGFNLTAGFRYMPVPKVELGAAVIYTDGNDELYGNDTDYSDTSITLSGQYFFTPAFSLGASAAFSSGEEDEGSPGGDNLSVFLRYSFGGPVSDMSDSSN